MHLEAEGRIRRLLHDLCGQESSNLLPLPASAVVSLTSGRGWGYSQFNEVLLLLGYDRISPEFFQFIIDGSTTYSPGNALTGAAALEAAVHRFRTVALLLFGNVKFAFKRLHADPEELAAWLGVLEPRDEQSFRDRHDPIQPIDPIDPADTYLLGYLIEGEIRDKLDANPHDAMYLALQERRREIIERGKKNQAAYLVSDHLDVYVATSMRARHEYALVSEFCQALFALPSLAPLKLRWFDPTQAYCHDRIDKGLAEALMLKRARCTIYLAQESDTLGKDSELASTLAQGKPVIAFVPEVDEAFVDGLVDKMRGSAPRSVKRA